MDKGQGRPERGEKRGRGGGDEGVSTAAEDEIEEFFAILRRVRAAARHFGGARQVMVTEKGPRWRPTFEWEDFAGLNGVKTDVKEGEREEKKKGGQKTEGENHGTLELDLNAEPEPEHSAHVS